MKERNKLIAVLSTSNKSATIITEGVFDEITVAEFNFDKELITVYPNVDPLTLHNLHTMYQDLSKIKDIKGDKDEPIKDSDTSS